MHGRSLVTSLYKVRLSGYTHAPFLPVLAAGRVGRKVDLYLVAVHNHDRLK